VTDYEILLMFDAELPAERQDEIIARTRQSIEGAGGTWTSHEPWGQRKLAYEIKHKTDGIYHLLRFKAEPAALDEVSRVLKITDGVMRHMATREPANSGTRPGPPVETEPEPRQDAEDQPSPVA
jgi:small subunit ribosomal protein S6